MCQPPSSKASNTNMGSSKTNGSSSNSTSPTDNASSGMIIGDPSSVRDLLRSINAPQSLSTNLVNLQSTTIGSIPGLLTLLSSNADNGVASASVEERRRVYGTNYTPSAPRKSLFQLFVDTFDDATVQILMAAAVVSLAIGIYGKCSYQLRWEGHVLFVGSCMFSCFSVLSGWSVYAAFIYTFSYTLPRYGVHAPFFYT